MGGGLLTEDILSAAKRELKEETGIAAKKWTNFLRIHTSNSVTDEEGFVFLAEDLSMGEPNFEDTEEIKIVKVPFSEAYKMAIENEITDSISLAGILKLGKKLGL
jgi:8-oxo-dGTP pyrophosphatase MutT (NUDIX family)